MISIDEINLLQGQIENLQKQNTNLQKECKKLEQIYILMKKILLKDENFKYKPIKNTTKQECYNTLGQIQEILETNKIYMR